MKKSLVTAAFILLTLTTPSCKTTVTSPLQVEYTGCIDEKGVSLTAKPPGWDAAVIGWQIFKKWVSE